MLGALSPQRNASAPPREQPYAHQHQTRAGHDPSVERLVEQNHAHQDGRQRPDHAGLRGQGGADALDRHHHHQHWRKGAQAGIEQRQPDHLGRDNGRSQRAQRHELHDAQHTGNRRGQPGQAQRAQAVHLFAAVDQVHGVTQRAAQHQRRAQGHVGAIQAQLVPEDDDHAHIAHGQGQQLLAPHLLLEQQHT